MHIRQAIKTIWLSSVISVLKEEIDKLYDGVDFYIDGKLKTLYGKLLLGDTLGQHEILGLKTGIGWALQKCCECYVTQEQFIERLYDEDCIKRNANDYLTQCSAIETAATNALKLHLSTTYGIVSRSSLLQIKGFDVTKQVVLYICIYLIIFNIYFF